MCAAKLVAVIQEVLNHAAFMHEGGVVDQNVDRAESIESGGEKRLDGRSLADIRRAVTYDAAQFVGQRSAGGIIDIGDHDTGAF